MSKPSFAKQDSKRDQSISSYGPLIVLISISALSAFAITRENLILMVWMHYFMGIFLCIFAMLKLFHPSQFANGFEMIDLLAKRFRPYGYVYSYLELVLGLGYLSFLFPLWVYSFTIGVLTFSALGFIESLRQGVDINCPCMGSILDVPVSTVTLSEDFTMVAMAGYMLLAYTA